MEETKITTTTKPRVSLKQSVTGKMGFELASSEGENLTEIIEGVEKAYLLLLKKFRKLGGS